MPAGPAGGGAWDLIRMGRFRFLAAGALCFLLGYLLALRMGSPWDPARLLLGYAIFGCGHLSVHYSNEYYDRHADRKGTVGAFSGGTGILVARPELAPAARRIALSLIGVSLALAIVFQILYRPEPWFLLFVAAGNLLGWFYSAPPLSLAYRGLGEAATVLGLGFMMPATGYLMAKGTLDPAIFLVCLPLLPLGYFFILAVELPDMEGDRAGGKRTAVVRMGREAAQRSIAAAALVATILCLFLGIFWPGPPADMLKVLAAISVIPLAAGIRVRRAGIRDRHDAEEQTRILVTSLVLFFLFSDIVLAAGLV
ncbi:MAG: prenyltransferase [Methanomicrobiales archaeon]|nr:prenyltransferase [Methanomicrobiales archaeon]MDD1645565.1 prenyltransferase [Methanomicrobiales archaeon]MDD1646280.1 prenyltransferase [Methanomicrobiales archaeon]